MLLYALDTITKVTVPSQILVAHFLCMKWHQKGKMKLRMLTQPLCLQERKLQQLSGELREKIPSPLHRALTLRVGAASPTTDTKSVGLPVPQHCPATSNFRIQHIILGNTDPSLSASRAIPLTQLQAPASSTSWPYCSIPPRTSFPAVPCSLCQRLLLHAWAWEGPCWHYLQAFRGSVLSWFRGCKALWRFNRGTPSWLGGSLCCRTEPTGTDSAQLWLWNWVWRKTSALCSLKSQHPS